MPDWNEDSRELRASLQQILSAIVQDAALRISPSRDLARQWQQLFLEGLDLPDPRYKGTFRGEPGLEHVRVAIANSEGIAPSQVSEALSRFEAQLLRLVAELDKDVPVGREPDPDQLEAILEVCAWAHAEWVRIHPFANGNGRTARLWANWIAVRYGLPPFVRLRPRPTNGYADAGAQAMRGNYQPTIKVFQRLLTQCLSEPGPAYPH